MNRLVFIFPQWQGGTTLGTYEGSKELKELYLQGVETTEVPVLTDPDSLEKKNNIIGYDAVLEQLKRATEVVKEKAPETIFTIGGGCDADVPAIAYLNDKLEGGLTILWFDAHGDLNSPEESKSGRFYGMPARILAGGSPDFLPYVPRPIHPGQYINIGGRAFDKAEVRYIEENGLRVWTVGELTPGPEALIESLKEQGVKNVYIHLDLDVLEPKEFTHMGFHVPNGLPTQTALDIIAAAKQNFHLAGLGIYEYLPAGGRNAFLEEVFRTMLTE